MDKPATFDSLVGRVLDGRYLVGEKIARGGMATVYEATDLRLDRVVALKVLPHALADDKEFYQRFTREARSAARLTHPNVVAVYDQSDDDGVLFLAMEYVAGRHTLRDVIRDEGPLSPVRALTLLEEVLKAIGAAHQSGIVHRDIKPENVLIDPRGQVKVADFGLARAISSATSATATGGLLLGTVSYLPPELVTVGTADARSDVYSLGIVAFELLTGCKPHTGESPIQVAYKHVHEDVCRPSELVDGIPPYVDAFVLRATRRDRDQRPADAHVMLQQLRRVRHALNQGVIDDQELTEDLTPTVSLHSVGGGRAPSAGAPANPAPPVVDRDEVFNFAAYDDFAADEPRTGPERTLLVGQTRGPDLGVRLQPTDPPSAPSHDAGPREFAGGAPTGNGHSGSTRVDGSQPSPRPVRKRKKAGWIALLLVLLLAAAAGMAGWYYGIGRFETTPNVISLREAAAKERVEGTGLRFEVASTDYSETVKPGHVISTDPARGEKILSDGTVMAVVSKGPERYDMPDLTKMSESEATEAITDSSLRVVNLKRVWSDDVRKGEVISFTPAAGVELKRDAKVSLVISRGPEPIQIVDFRGKNAAEAATDLKALGLDVLVKERYDNEVADGILIRQTPSQGTLVAGDRITLVASLGPRLIEVPNVYGFGTQDAVAAFEDLGFEVETQESDPYFGLGFVVGQSVPAGDTAPFGSTLTLTVV
ncbi:MAG: serine/threonine protein kinase [Nocardioidaceae bacterium]|nr:serine/threonine protein kinase [Nocardioidaceae bacterium]